MLHVVVVLLTLLNDFTLNMVLRLHGTFLVDVALKVCALTIERRELAHSGLVHLEHLVLLLDLLDLLLQLVDLLLVVLNLLHNLVGISGSVGQVKL